VKEACLNNLKPAPTKVMTEGGLSMENKKLQQPIPEELKDAQLDQVTGGTKVIDTIMTTVQMSSLADGGASLEKEAEERRQAVLTAPERLRAERYALDNVSRIGEPALSNPEDALWSKPAPTT